MDDNDAMSSLEQLGVRPPVVNSPALSSERCRLGHEAYVEQATAVLDSVSDFAVTELPHQLNNYISRWHPNGFMVYQLGTSPGLGMLRLHVWPHTTRQLESTGEAIHDHAWHIASLVLRGVYKDTFFDLQPEPVANEAERKAKGLLTLFRTDYTSNDTQELIADGTTVRAVPTGRRIVPQASTHSIRPDLFHQPNIDPEDATITLVLSSFRVHERGPHAVFDGPSAPIPETRRLLSSHDIDVTKALFLG